MQKKKIQSHNLTHQQHNDLQYAQMSGEVEMVDANKNSEYQIPVHEQHLVHAVIETKSFDSNTGVKTSVPITQVFYPAEFLQMEKENAFVGKDVEIVHKPEGLGAIKLKPEDKSNLNEPADLKKNSEDVIDQIANGGGVGGPIGGVATIVPPVVDTTGTGEAGNAGGADDKSTPLSRMNKEQLRAEYKRLWEDDAPEDAGNAELREAIQQKTGEAGNAE